MDIQNFINQVAAGNAVASKEVLNDVLSAKAFEALDTKKIEMAQSIFMGKEEKVDSETEEITTEE